MADHIIATGADANYYALLCDLLDSLRDRGIRAPIGVLDFGLEEAQRRALDRDGIRIVAPGWDFDFPGIEKLPSFYKAYTTRPWIPKHFPGYDYYLWLDCDIWVQDAAVLDLYLAVARAGKLAITPHIGRSYESFKKWQRPRFNTAMFREYVRGGWGWRTANEFARFPICNCGAFALKNDAPHWALWRRAMHPKRTKMWEQTPLNYVIYHDKAPTGLLPDLCNWICIDAPPMVDEKRGLLVEPEPPHQTIGLIHLVEQAKTMTFPLATLQGGTVMAPLRYSYWRERRAMTAVSAAV